jgi:hypothetical protein
MAQMALNLSTLFTIFEADVSASDLRSTGSYLSTLINLELLSEGLPLDAFADPGSEEVVYAKTADRSVLGCINDMA